jgi:hypothetical protein
MTHRKGAVWTERLLVVMILVSLAGTLNLVLAVHRRAASLSTTSPAQASKFAPPPALPDSPPLAKAAVSHPSPPQPVGRTKATASWQTRPSPHPDAPVEAPTVKILAGMTSAMGKEIDATREADRRAAKLETARLAAVAESSRWKRRESLVKQQIATLTQRADRLEQDALALDAERDVLARERDVLKAALTKVSQRSRSAVLPYKGPNGTWRRPIVLECTGGVAKLQPRGPTFSMLDLSPLIHPRSSPVVLAIAREMLHIERADTPDGAPAVPYLVFLVRPNGIRPYYEARARLEPLGIAFGYELIEQDLVVEIPDFDDLTTWDGTVPLDEPAVAATAGKTRSGWPSTTQSEPGEIAVEPSRRPGERETGIAWGQNPGPGNRPGSAAGARSDEGSPEDFVWPTHARLADPGGGPGSNAAPWGAGDDARIGGSPGPSPTVAGPTPGSSSAFREGEGRPGGGAAWIGSPPSMGTTPLRGGRPGSTLPLGGGSASRDRHSVTSGKGLAGLGTSGTGALPDLEPTGDAASLPSLPAWDGSMSGSAASGGSPNRFAAVGGVGLSSPGDPPSATTERGIGVPVPADGPDQPGRAAPAPPGPASTAPDAGGWGRYPVFGSAAGRVRSNAGAGADSSSETSDSPAATAAGNLAIPQGGRSSAAGSDSASGPLARSNATESWPVSPFGPSLTASASGSASASTTGWGSSPESSGPQSAPSPFAGLTSSPASTSSRNASSSLGGQPGSSGNPSAASGLSLPSFNLNPDPDSEPDSLKGFVLPSLSPPDRPPGAIEVPFEIVVVCRRDDLLLHPGGYRLTAQALQEGGGKGSSMESLLKRELRAMVRRRAQVDPLIRPRPSLRFLVETDGATTFWTARRQLLFSGLDWPMSLQVAGPQGQHVLNGETW